MKGLTVRQPHAAEIAAGRKRIENRSWPPLRGFTGPLVIQAGVRYDGEAARHMPRGALAVVRSIAAHPKDACRDDAEFRQWSDGTFSCAEVGGVYCASWRWHWALYDVLAFPEPMPCAGRFGLWDVPADVERAASELLERAS